MDCGIYRMNVEFVKSLEMESTLREENAKEAHKEKKELAAVVKLIYTRNLAKDIEKNI